MEMPKKKLPIGIENFDDMRKENFYYVDKTGFIVELLHSWGAVNLFTRPRRFGKSLNMNMLEHFFSIEGDKSIFDGLGIIIEVKYAHDGNMDAACEKAQKQIESPRYEEILLEDGIEKILKYAVACYKKRCKVILAENKFKV